MLGRTLHTRVENVLQMYANFTLMHCNQKENTRPTFQHDPQGQYGARDSCRVVNSHKYYSGMNVQPLRYPRRVSIKRPVLWDHVRAFPTVK